MADREVVLDVQGGCSLDAASKVLHAIGKAFPQSTVSNVPGTAMRITVVVPDIRITVYPPSPDARHGQT